MHVLFVFMLETMRIIPTGNRQAFSQDPEVTKSLLPEAGSGVTHRSADANYLTPCYSWGTSATETENQSMGTSNDDESSERL